LSSCKAIAPPTSLEAIKFSIYVIFVWIRLRGGDVWVNSNVVCNVHRLVVMTKFFIEDKCMHVETHSTGPVDPNMQRNIVVAVHIYIARLI